MHREASRDDPLDAAPGIRPASTTLAEVSDLLPGDIMNYEITLEAIAGDDFSTEEHISESFDALMEALVDLGVDAPFVGGSVATRQVEVSMVVDATSEEEAFTTGARLIRQALGQAGIRLVSEPAQPAAFSWSSTSVRPAV
jgi:hypothetical protein